MNKATSPEVDLRWRARRSIKSVLTSAVAGQLNLAGAAVRVYDPQGMDNARKVFPTLDYAASLDDALTHAELVILATEWDEFKQLDPEHAGTLVAEKTLIDARNVLPTDVWQAAGWELKALGRSL